MCTTVLLSYMDCMNRLCLRITVRDREKQSSQDKGDYISDIFNTLWIDINFIFIITSQLRVLSVHEYMYIQGQATTVTHANTTLYIVSKLLHYNCIFQARNYVHLSTS